MQTMTTAFFKIAMALKLNKSLYFFNNYAIFAMHLCDLSKHPLGNTEKIAVI